MIVCDSCGVSVKTHERCYSISTRDDPIGEYHHRCEQCNAAFNRFRSLVKHDLEGELEKRVDKMMHNWLEEERLSELAQGH